MQDSNLRMHESKSCALPTWLIPNISGERTGIRTPDTRLRRALLYPAELCTHIFTQSGADEGSRTPTPKALDPKSSASANSATSAYFFLGGGWWIRTTESTANRFTVCPLWPLGNPSIPALTSTIYLTTRGLKNQAVFLLISQLKYNPSVAGGVFAFVRSRPQSSLLFGRRM